MDALHEETGYVVESRRDNMTELYFGIKSVEEVAGLIIFGVFLVSVVVCSFIYFKK